MRQINHAGVIQTEIDEISCVKFTRIIFHIQDRMITGCADHFNSILQRDQIAAVSAEVRLSDSCQRASADSPVFILLHPSKCVHAELADRIRRLVPDFQNFCAKDKAVFMHRADIYMIELRKVSRIQNALANPQVVNAVRDRSFQNTDEAGGRSSREDLQLSSKSFLNLLCKSNKFLQFLRRSDNRTIAADIDARACKMQVRHFPFHLNRGLGHFVFVPPSLAQIADVGHEQDIVDLMLAPRLFIQRLQNGKFAVQRVIAVFYNICGVADHRNADQHDRKIDSGFLYCSGLVQTGCGQRRDAGSLKLPDSRKVRVHPLNYSADLNSALCAFINGIRGILS